MQQVDFNLVIQLYKEQVSNLQHENILLSAYVKQLESKISKDNEGEIANEYMIEEV